MKKIAALAIILLASSGSGSDNRKLDPHNSFHCGVAFTVMLGIADDIPITSEERRQVVGRVKALAERLARLEAVRAKKLPESERTKELSHSLAKRLLANSDELKSLYAACLREARNR